MSKAKKTRVSLTLTQAYIEPLDQLVEAGLGMDRQDVIRVFIREGFVKHGIDPFRDMSQKTDPPSP